jgi:hypothetical protein
MADLGDHRRFAVDRPSRTYVGISGCDSVVAPPDLVRSDPGKGVKGVSGPDQNRVHIASDSLKKQGDQNYPRSDSAQPSGSYSGGSFSQAFSGSTNIFSASAKDMHSNTCIALTIGH